MTTEEIIARDEAAENRAVDASREYSLLERRRIPSGDSTVEEFEPAMIERIFRLGFRAGREYVRREG